jgi:hypothetical protein
MAGYESVQAEIERCMAHYAAALAMPGHAVAYMAAIAPAAFDAFPRGSTLRYPVIFAEIIAFHAIKAGGLPFDQASFRKASLAGNMPVHQRPWLLRYAPHLPPALRVACKEPSPEAWLSRMPPGPAIDAARELLAAEGARLATMRPRIRAGACVVAAWRRLGLHKSGDRSLQGVLGAAGIGHATAYNAALRVGLIQRQVRDPPAAATPALA